MKNILDLKILVLLLAVYELISLAGTGGGGGECMTEAWDCGKEGLDVRLL